MCHLECSASLPGQAKKGEIGIPSLIKPILTSSKGGFFDLIVRGLSMSYTEALERCLMCAEPLSLSSGFSETFTCTTHLSESDWRQQHLQAKND